MKTEIGGSGGKLGADGRPLVFEVKTEAGVERSERRAGDIAFLDEVVPRLQEYQDVVLAVFHGPLSVAPLGRRLTEVLMEAAKAIGSGISVGLVDVGTRMGCPDSKGVGFLLTNYACGNPGAVFFKARGPGVPAARLRVEVLEIFPETLVGDKIAAWLQQCVSGKPATRERRR